MNHHISKIIAEVKILPVNQKLNRIEAKMPVNITKVNDQMFHITFPLLANLKTFTTRESDIDTTINEALTCFFNLANKANGIRTELTAIGWQLKNDRKIRFRVKEDSTSGAAVENSMQKEMKFDLHVA